MEHDAVTFHVVLAQGARCIVSVYDEATCVFHRELQQVLTSISIISITIGTKLHTRSTCRWHFLLVAAPWIMIVLDANSIGGTTAVLYCTALYTTVVQQS